MAIPSTNGANSTSGNHRLIFLIAGVLALIAGIWAFQTWRYRQSHESTDDAQIDGDIIPVLARVGGYVTKVTTAENQHVQEDQLLVMIDDAQYRVALAQADADLAAVQATVSGKGDTGQAEAQVATATGQHQALDAQIVAAQAADKRAQSDLARIRDLVDKQIVSRQQLDAAQAAADAAKAQLIATQRQAAAGGAQVSTARAGVRIAEARLQAAQAARDNAQLQLGYTRVMAPAAGLVSRKEIEPGQLVSPGQPLMSIVSDTGVWVTANFKETQVGDIRVGQPVEFSVDAYDRCKAAGRVASISGATGARFALLPPDNSTGNFTKVVQRVPVRIAITKPCDKRPLRPGLSVDVHVQTQ
jgi:membrane fusion protein (multidrug efflux system)